RNADLPPGIDAAIGRSDSGLSAKPVSPAGFYFFTHHETQMRGAMSPHLHQQENGTQQHYGAGHHSKGTGHSGDPFYRAIIWCPTAWNRFLTTAR
ncbi:MAG TPA: hypothetical protein VEW72_02540, partial [Burkholderiales bacterium]|nr:hypothetical protein [Burkholderiales bacterium]